MHFNTLAWIAPQNFHPSSSTNSATISGTKQKQNYNKSSNKQAFHVSDFHWPVPATSKDPICLLQWWASGSAHQKVHENVMLCDKCRVSLCLKCFKTFHIVSDVITLKSEVLKKMV